MTLYVIISKNTSTSDFGESEVVGVFSGIDKLPESITGRRNYYEVYKVELNKEYEDNPLTHIPWNKIEL